LISFTQFFEIALVFWYENPDRRRPHFHLFHDGHAPRISRWRKRLHIYTVSPAQTQ
jgi:hypothetical protein